MLLTLSLLEGDFFSSADNVLNSLDPDQDRQIVRSDLDPNKLKLW